MGRLQGWLQRREWSLAWWLGNRISDVRYWLWRARGSKWPKGHEWTGPTITIDTRHPNATSNTDSERETKNSATVELTLDGVDVTGESVSNIESKP